MEKQVKDLWVKDLRSGEYQQARERLQMGNSHCCLGVLCRVAEKHGVTVKKKDDGSLAGDHLGKQLEVKEWAGMRSNTGLIIAEFVGDLADMNDAGMNFECLANVIEENYKHL